MNAAALFPNSLGNIRLLFFFFKLSAIKMINIDTRARSEAYRRYIIDFIADPRRLCEKNYSGKNILVYRYTNKKKLYFNEREREGEKKLKRAYGKETRDRMFRGLIALSRGSFN